MDEIINFITESNSRIIFFSASFSLTLWVWYCIWQTPTNVPLKLLYSFFAAIPFIGSLLVLWIIYIPDSQPIDKQATMAIYGEGSKFMNSSKNKLKKHKK